MSKKQQEIELEENIRFFKERFQENSVQLSLPDSLHSERLSALLEGLNQPEPEGKEAMVFREHVTIINWLTGFFAGQNLRKTALACTLIVVAGLTMALARYSPNLYGTSPIVMNAAQPEAASEPKAAAFSMAPELSADEAAAAYSPENDEALQGEGAPRAMPRTSNEMAGANNLFAKPNPCGSSQCTLPEDAVFAENEQEIKDSLTASFEAFPENKTQPDSLELKGPIILEGKNTRCELEQKAENVELTFYKINEDGSETKSTTYTQQGKYLDFIWLSDDTYSLFTNVAVTKEMIEQDDFMPKFDNIALPINLIQMNRFPDYPNSPEYTISSTLTAGSASAFAVLYLKN